MPFTKPRARNSSVTIPKYVDRQLFYLDDVHLLIITSKLLPQLYFNGALGPFGNSFPDVWKVQSSWRISTAYCTTGQSDHYWLGNSMASPNKAIGTGMQDWDLARPQILSAEVRSQQRPSNRDEFDGLHQLLDRPSVEVVAAQEHDLPYLPMNLYVNEQDGILSQVNDCLSECAFNFVAKYQFPIPLEPDKRPVRIPADREWTEWVYLLKKLATKRRIPARVLFNNQIKQLVTVLENSLEMRHAAKHQSRPLKDDRNVLQLISAGLQVAKIFKDATCMSLLDNLYVQTETKIQIRKDRNDRKDVSSGIGQTQIFRHTKREGDDKIGRGGAVNGREDVLVEVDRKDKKCWRNNA